MAAIYMVGIVSYQGGRSVFLFCLLVLSLFVFLYSLLFSSHVFRLHGDWFLFLLPILFSVGYFRSNTYTEACDAATFLSLEGKGEVFGTVESIKGTEEKYQLILRESKVHWKGRWETCKGILVYLKQVEGIHIGNQISIKGKLLPLTRASNPGQFDEFSYFQKDQISFKVQGNEVKILDTKTSFLKDSLYHLKEYFLSALLFHLPKKEAGILSLMLFSEKSFMEEETKLLYQRNGIAHILAISGLHISLLGMGLFRFLRKIFLPLIPSILAVSLFLILYGILTDFSVSATRAILMILFSFGAILLGKTYDSISALAFSSFFILFSQPFELFSGGFQLSFLSVFGIAIISPALEECFSVSKVKWLISPFLSSLSVTFMTLPVLLFHFFEWPLYSLFLNLIILPFLSFVVLFGLCVAILGGIFFEISSFLSGPAYYILQWFEVVCQFAKNFPFHTLLSGRPTWYSLFFYYASLLLFLILCYEKKNKKFCRFFLCLPFAALLFCFYHPDPGLQIYFLDVGQGDGIYIQTKEVCILVDGGSSTVKEVGKYRMIPFLKQQGNAVIDYCFLTHLDADHINGIEELLSKMEIDQPHNLSGYQGNIIIRNLVVSKTVTKEKEWEALAALAKQKQVNLYSMEAGESLNFGELNMKSIHPFADFTGAGNAASLVLALSYGEFNLLLTGDLEGEGERLVADKLRGASFDLLKVAHHGSKNSSKAYFLDAISVKKAVISSGRGNTYGHPHVETLERLEEHGVEICIMEENGAVKVTCNGELVEYENFLSLLH